MFKKVLIANRGAIATRIIRSLKQMGCQSVAIYNEADVDSLHVLYADEAYSLGEGRAVDTYLDQDKIFEIMQRTGHTSIMHNALRKRTAQMGTAVIKRKNLIVSRSKDRYRSTLYPHQSRPTHRHIRDISNVDPICRFTHSAASSVKSARGLKACASPPRTRSAQGSVCENVWE